MIKQNLHTHSLYDDGKDPIEQMAQSAYEKGFTVLGFSGHGFNQPLDMDSMSEQDTLLYLEDIQKAKAKWKGRMEIYAGIEQDSMNRLDTRNFDYVIASVHYLKKNGGIYPVDYSLEQFEFLLQEIYKGDICALVSDYYQAVEEMMEFEEGDIIGHIDLISKYNEGGRYFDPQDDWYFQAARRAIDKGIEKGKVFEMNTGAMARGYRSQPYPDPALLEYMAGRKAKVCINTDCHNRKDLDLGIGMCLELARQAGLEQLYTLENGSFVPRSIEEFTG